MEAFIEETELTYIENIYRYNSNIQMLQYELNYINDLLTLYMNKHSGFSYTLKERCSKMRDIRERIPEIYEDIKYYKDCISVEESEIDRLYDTYYTESDDV